MPEPMIRSVLLHEAGCLSGPREPVCVATIQPGGELVFTDELGPHYANGHRNSAHIRVKAFLQLVEEKDVDLAIAPEYFAPLDSINEILRNLDLLRNGTIYVLPIESLSVGDYEALYESALELGVITDRSQLDSTRDRTFVNPCAVLCRNRETLKLILQTKVYESRLEFRNMVPGTELLAIEGENIVLVVVVCSDANPPEYHRYWARAAARKGGAYVIHTQWNPHPDYEQYPIFWSSILNAAQGAERLLFSLNWAAGSNLLSGNQVKLSINRPRTRIFRGKKLQHSPHYPKRSRVGLHLQHQPHGRDGIWEIWHVIPNRDHAYILNMCRPFEDVPLAQRCRDFGILHGHYFDRTEDQNRFHENPPNDLGRQFWGLCERLGYERQIWRDLETANLCELERLCNTLLMVEDGKWLAEDVNCRIPTAPHLCGPDHPTCDGCIDSGLSCSQARADWERKCEFVAQCLDSFRHSHLSEQERLEVRPPRTFPLNLIAHDSIEKGWLFHGQGRSALLIEKDIEYFLRRSSLHNFRGVLNLCVVSVNGQLDAERIFAKPGEIANIDEASQDISSPNHYPQIEITIL